MVNPRKKPGDAVLSRDGTVKVEGVMVGYWWVDGNDLYHFDFKKPGNPAWDWGCVTDIQRHSFKTAIPPALAQIGKMPGPAAGTAEPEPGGSGPALKPGEIPH